MTEDIDMSGAYYTTLAELEQGQRYRWTKTESWSTRNTIPLGHTVGRFCQALPLPSTVTVELPVTVARRFSHLPRQLASEPDARILSKACIQALGETT